MNIKKLKLIIPIIATYTFCNYANALSIGGGGIGGGDVELQTSCEEVTCPNSAEITLPSILPDSYGCEIYSSSIKCYKKSGTTYYFKQCTQCRMAYTLTNKQREECSVIQGSLSGPFLPYCECICNNCTSTDWSANGTGYEKHTEKSCNCNSTVATCESSTSYRCAAGYYGSSSNGTSGCTQCPTWSGVYTNSAKTSTARGTSTAGTTTITGCYIPSGTYYDATGTFTLTTSCNYK